MKEDHVITDVAHGNSAKQSGGGWVFPALLMVVLGGAVWLGQRESEDKTTTGSGATTEAAAWTPSPQPEGETVGLTIDFGNGATKSIAALPWRAGLTIEHLLQEAAEFRPRVAFTQKGQGEQGFLVSLDGLENQGSGGQNWQYRVNGKHGEVSFCVQPLEPGDQVLWGFAIKIKE